MKLPIHFAFFAVTLVAPLAASATTVLPPSEDDLIRNSAVIGLATVQRLEVAFSPRGEVMTRAELLVEQGIRGAGKGEFIIMEYPGGKLPNGLRSTVPGAPALKVGDRVFTYLSSAPNNPTRLRPIGLSFGVLNVRRDAKGVLRASRTVDGLSFVSREQKPLPQEMFVLRDVPVNTLMSDAQTRMRRLNIEAGKALGTNRPVNAMQVKP